MLEGLRQKTTTLKQTCLKKEEQFTKTKDNNKDQKAQLNRDKVALEESSNQKNSKRRQTEQDLRQKAERIREGQREDQEKRVAALNATIL